MPPTDAQKVATAKWQKKAMATLAVKLKIDEVVAFKAYCAGQGKTANAVLAEHVRQCIGNHPRDDKDK